MDLGLSRSLAYRTATGFVLILAAVGFTAAHAATANAKSLPRILDAPASVRGGDRVVVLARTKPSALCHLNLSRAGRIEKKSVGVRAASGEIFFHWRAPLSLRAGKHTATVKCKNVSHVAHAVIHAIGEGSHSLALAPIHVTPIRDKEPRAVKNLSADGYPPYHTLLIPGSAWFGGHGVNVFSNGASGNVTGPNDVFQCVELVERFLVAEHFGPAISGNANALYANAPASAYDHHLNSSGYVPVPGDIIVFGGGQDGHVAIVDQVVPGLVRIVEQNASPTGRATLTLHGSTVGGEYGMTVIGILHSKANTDPGGIPSPTAKAWQVAWNAGTFWTTGTDVKGNLGLGIAGATSPSIAALTTGGWEAAFRAADGHLWVVGADDKGDTGLGVAPGTSPSITALKGGGWEVAFHAAGGDLWVIGTDDRGDMHLGMTPGSNPSIAGLSNGSWEVAWSSGGDLWITGPTDVRGDMNLGIAAGTDPSITKLANGNWEVAWNSGGSLWVTGPTDVRGNMHLGIAANTSPSITGLSGGSWEVAWNAGGSLWVTGPTDVRGNMHLGISAGTSPSIAGLGNGSWEAAWNAGGIWITGPTDVRGNMHLGITDGSSPSITGY